MGSQSDVPRQCDDTVRAYSGDSNAEFDGKVGGKAHW